MPPVARINRSRYRGGGFVPPHYHSQWSTYRMCASCPHIFRFDRIRGLGTTASTKENSGNSINLEAVTAASYLCVPLPSNLAYKEGSTL